MGRAKTNDELAEREELLSLSAADSGTLRIIARSFAVIALRLAPKKFENDSDRIPFLNALGLSNSEIAKLLGTTTNTVAVRLSVVGKSKKRKKKKGSKSRAKN